MKTIDAATLKQWLDKGEALLLDVREPAEHAACCIDNAHLMPLGKLSKQSLNLKEGQRLVIHCQRGGRGTSACERLLAEDPSLEIYNLEGGIQAWQSAGLPIKTSGRRILPLDRQVQLTIGLCVLTGSILGYVVSPLFFLFTGFFGAGLTFAGLTGFCGLAMIMARMPWNQQGRSNRCCAT
ncbi:DUF2892 domain-containing protein [bacterium]|nr:DUF2892 domain-containing protein [bacterium]